MNDRDLIYMFIVLAVVLGCVALGTTYLLHKLAGQQNDLIDEIILCRASARDSTLPSFEVNFSNA